MSTTRRHFLATTAALAGASALPIRPVQAAAPLTIVMMPKLVGIPYYNVVKDGVDNASKELAGDTKVIWQGPTVDQVDKQIEMLDNIIESKPDVIAVAANDPQAIVPVLKKAKAAGIHVITWDGDAEFREAFVNFVNYDAFGAALADEMAQQVGAKATVAVVTSTLTAPNQSAWLAAIRKQLAAKYPGITIVDVKPSQEDQQLAFQVTQDLLKSNTTIKGIFAITTVALPGAAEAVKQMGLTGKIAVVGNSTPNAIRDYVTGGQIKSAVPWNPSDHGYLTVYAARQLASAGLQVGKDFTAGHIGERKPFADKVSMQILLGPPLVFTKANIDRYHF